MSENTVPDLVHEYRVLSSAHSVLPSELARVPLTLVNEMAIASEAAETGEYLFIATPKDLAANLSEDNAEKIGTIVRVHDVVRGPNGYVAVVQGVARGRLLDLINGPVSASATVAPSPLSNNAELVNSALAMVEDFKVYLDKNGNSPDKVALAIDPLRKGAEAAPLDTAYAMAWKMELTEEKKRAVLNSSDPQEIIHLVYAEIINRQTQLAVQEDYKKKDHEFMLRKQRDEIDKELNGEDGENEFDTLAKKIEEAGMPEEAKAAAEDDLKKLRKMNPMDPSVNITRTHLDWLLAMPWNKNSEIVQDLNQSEKTLNNDHYGLDDVKQNILEQLAVQLNTGKMEGSIICLVGPAGVGKTSIGESIARATGRKFVTAALGGVNDEGSIRGFRITYQGAAPGKIVEALKAAGTNNPVIQLDEIDKLASGGNHGDPAAVLHEVLDPAQNNKFKDQYLNVPLDLSKVLFVATANDLSTIIPSLRDRMEIIEIPGYTDNEKIEIAKQFLIGKQMKATGLTKKQFSITADALSILVSDYSDDAGVRKLDRRIRTLCRKTVMEIRSGSVSSVKITPKKLKEYLGTPKMHRASVGETDEVGHVNGLYVSGAGGGIIPFDTVLIPAKAGSAVATGSLQDVMKESVSDGYDFIRSHAKQLGISQETLDAHAVHIKANDGATPKDGPSAGLAMATAMISALTGIAVRRDVAMTGEIGLLGQAMPIGGLKSKLMGAVQAGVKTVLVPRANKADLEEVSEEVKSKLNIILVDNEMDVLDHALVRKLQPLPDVAPTTPATTSQALQDLLAQPNVLRELFMAALAAPSATMPVPANDLRPAPAAQTVKTAKAKL